MSKEYVGKDGIKTVIENMVQHFQGQIDSLQSEVDDLNYSAITIKSFTNNVNTVEKGSTVTSITFNWTTSKTPTKLLFDGSEISASATSKTLTGLSLTSNKTYKLQAIDERGANPSASTTISFVEGVYYGVSSATEITNDLILGLTKKLQSSKALTFSATAGAGQYVYYALPKSYGTCSFNVGGFDGGFTLVDTISFTNASGYTDTYYVYKSDNANLGTISVKVS